MKVEISELVIEIDGQTLVEVAAVDKEKGLLLGRLELKPYSDGDWGLRRLFVHPQWRGRGLGRRLVTAAKVLVIANGGTGITLIVRRDNAKAIKLYEMAHFREAPEMVNELPEGCSASEHMVMTWEA